MSTITPVSGIGTIQGPWIGTPLEVTGQVTVNGKIVYCGVDSTYVKMVDLDGNAKYYQGTFADFNITNYIENRYASANGNYILYLNNPNVGTIRSNRVDVIVNNCVPITGILYLDTIGTIYLANDGINTFVVPLSNNWSRWYPSTTIYNFDPDLYLRAKPPSLQYPIVPGVPNNSPISINLGAVCISPGIPSYTPSRTQPPSIRPPSIRPPSIRPPSTQSTPPSTQSTPTSTQSTPPSRIQPSTSIGTSPSKTPSISPSAKPDENPPSKTIFIIVIVSICILLGGWGYYIYTKQSKVVTPSSKGGIFNVGE